MSIESKIREIAESKFGNFSYVFEDWNGAATVIDDVALPAIVCILPTGGYLDLSHGLVKDKENLMLAFVDKVERDANGDDNERVYTEMKRVAARFLKAINDSRYFDPIDGDVRYTTIYESASAYFTGVFVELTLKELQGRCL